MPPKTTSTLVLPDQLRGAGRGATASSVAPSSMCSSSRRPSRPPLALMSPIDHPRDVRVGEPDERERAGLLGDHSDPDRAIPLCWSCGHAVPPSVVAPSAARIAGSDAACDDRAPRAIAEHREDSPSWTRRSASPNSSPRSRSRRTTRSASRSSRSCARACSRRGCATPRTSTGDVRDTAYWVALLRYVGCTGPRARGRRRCSATRSRSARRRSSTTPATRPR